MLKKTALSLFGLVGDADLFQSAAGTRRRGGFDRASLSASGLRSSVPVCGARALMSLTGRLLTSMADVCSSGLGLSPGLLRSTAYIVPRYEHREFVERRPYWRR